MIPARMPPPADTPTGWSPNAMGSTQAQIAAGVQSLTSAELEAFLLAARSPIQISRTLTHLEARALNTVPQDIVPAQGAGLVAQPLWWAMEYANGGTGYGAQIQVSLRYQGIAVDLGTTKLVSNVANRQQWLYQPVDNVSLTNNALAGNLPIQARAVADVANGSGFVLITVCFCVLPELP